MIQEEMIKTKDEGILVVDDYPYNLTAVETILTGQGYKNILMATSGTEALSIINEKKPDLVLLDIMMPGMDGYDVCETLKSNKETSDIPVIMLTAKISSKDLKRGFEVGAVDYIGKPFDKVELIARIESSLKLKKARDELKSFKNQEVQKLDSLVKKRTIELEQANKLLQQEISERNQAEVALWDTEEQYSTLVDLSPDGVILAQGGKIVFANNIFYEMLGFEESKVKGKSMFSLMAKTCAETVSALSKQEREMILKNITNEITGELKPCSYQVPFIKTSGEKIWVEVKTKPIEYRGKPAEVILVCDITERKRSEEELQKSEKRYRMLAENLTDVVWATDMELKIVYISPSGAMFGFKTENIENKMIWESMKGIKVKDPESMKNLIKGLSKMLSYKELKKSEESKPFTIDFEIVLKNGGKIWSESKFNVMRDSDGNPQGILGITRDITERKHAEEKLKKALEILEHSNKELVQFAFIASHDLQEPLRMIGSYVQLLSRRYKGMLDSDADEFIDYAVEGAKRMKMMLNDLLEYSHIGTSVKSLKPTDCGKALDQALLNLTTVIEKSGAVITNENMPTVMADDNHLAKLFENLIGNAIKYRSEKPPNIHVSAEQQNDEWIISVNDNGIGIEPEYNEYIFLIFRQLNKEVYGTGAGLAICKKIVERYGGKIGVESKIGEGSTFYFTIPIKNEKEE